MPVRAADCPRLHRDFLEEERKVLGERTYRQEYCCEFTETEDSLFALAAIDAAFPEETAPLMGPDGRRARTEERAAVGRQRFVGVDLGQCQDYPAVAVLERVETAGEFDPAYWAYRKQTEVRVVHAERIPRGRRTRRWRRG